MLVGGLSGAGREHLLLALQPLMLSRAGGTSVSTTLDVAMLPQCFWDVPGLLNLRLSVPAWREAVMGV